MRLFIDCDGTLVIYDKGAKHNPYGLWKGDPYRVNFSLVTFVKRYYARHRDAMIVIWSGGGKDYAEQVALVVGLGGVDAAYMVKNKDTLGLVTKENIVVDDQPIKVEAVVSPPDFFELKESWGTDMNGNGLDHSGDNCEHHICIRGPRGQEGKPGGVQ